jgi:hypothetical protein
MVSNFFDFVFPIVYYKKKINNLLILSFIRLMLLNHHSIVLLYLCFLILHFIHIKNHSKITSFNEQLTTLK